MNRRDVLTALILFVLTLVVGLGLLDKGHVWGDDFAGYILQAKSLVDGDIEGMMERAAVLHPSPRSFDEGVTDDSALCYVWGLPMVLSLVYRLVGYDAPVGDVIIAYKIPGVVFFACLAAVLFLFYRRRFGYAISLFLSFMLLSHNRVFGDINQVMTDIPCMAASMASLLGVELFVGEKREGRRAAIGVLLGVAMWYTAVVRLNGITVIACVLLFHILTLVKERVMVERFVRHVLPWALFLLLYGVTNMILPEVNSNASHMASVTINRIKDNILYYYRLMEAFFAEMLPAWVPGRKCIHLAMYALIALGLADRGWRRSEVHLSILMCGTGIVLLALPYGQDVRYMFNILPLMLLFAAHGASVLTRWAERMVKCAQVKRIGVLLGFALMLAAAALRVNDLAAWKRDMQVQGGRERLYEAYHPESKGIYAYIQTHVEEDAVIAYIKPRVLYLNTGRMSLMVGVNGHHFYDADYLLTFRNFSDELGGIVWPELREELTLVYENHEYELYRISDAYRSLRYEDE